MFEVERSSAGQITVRDYDDGHLWVFVVDADDGGTLSVSRIVANASARHAPGDRASKALSFAELEAWKRGLID